jgi:dCMP deaminase
MSNKWHKYFADIAMLVSSMSKDRSTKVGAVIVRDRNIISTGYNGFPRGCSDDVEERHQRPLKYAWTVHAEANAILNCAREGISTKDTIMYCTLHPCSGCATNIVQAGVKIIIVLSDDNPRFVEDFMVARQILHEGCVKVINWKPE